MVGGRRSKNRYGRKQKHQPMRWPMIGMVFGAAWLCWGWIAGDADPVPAQDLGLAANANPGAQDGAAPATDDSIPTAPVDPFAQVISAIGDGDLPKAKKLNGPKLGSKDAATAARARLFKADIAYREGAHEKAAEQYEALTADTGPVGATACVRLAELVEKQGDSTKALAAWTRAWRHKGSSERRSEIAARAWELARRSLFSPAFHRGCETYTVRPGDSLSRIAGYQKTTVGLLRLVNQLKNDRIHPGDRLKIVRGPCRLVVDKSRFAMALFLGDTLVKEYQVCIGKQNRTPAATFTVATKKAHPDWYHDGTIIKYGHPDNILGTRWMGFRNETGLPRGLGIHGTSQPESIPGNRSMGCVRMRNAEVEELFAIVSRGTKVEIRD